MNLEEIEKKLMDVEATQKIINLHNEYLFYLNNRQWRDTTDCFTKDAVADIHEKRKGREEIYKLFTDVIAKLNTGKSRDVHFAVQPVIEVEGDKARGHWLIYIFISDAKSGNAKRWIPGRYDCEYTKENTKWKFSSLTYTSPWPREG
jgi:ketosteroid isomerase-like protein